MRIKELFALTPAQRRVPRQPLVIAEAGVNHGGSLDMAYRHIEEAREGGADAIKFQTYKADTIAVKDSPAYWDTTKEPTKSQHELFSKYDKFWKTEFEKLKKRCDSAGIEFMSTPFDLASAEFLNDMMDSYKISSSDLTNRPFIERIASFKKPILLSTGAADLPEIREAVSWIAPSGAPLCLLHCVLNYPCGDENANLAMIRDLGSKFPDAILGYSDHTTPKDMKTLETAFLLGAIVLEKHFTHDKTLPGNDHYHAMDKEDLKLFRRDIERLLVLLGSPDKAALPSEEPARLHARRSLVAARSIAKGSIIASEHLTWKRPAAGVSPKDIGRVVGRKAVRDIGEDEVIRWEMLAE